MKFVLDTHTLLWRLLDPKRLSKMARSIFMDGECEFFVPTISLLEIQYLNEVGRIEAPIGEIREALSEAGNFTLLPFDEDALFHALNLSTTRDPFDRVILSQALALSMKILTKDRWMKQTAPHLVVWH